MTTRTTLRLGGLTAAIVLSLALVSSASARPTGIYNQPRTTSVSVASKQVTGSWLQHQSGTSVNRAAPTAPTDRLSPTGAPRVPVTVIEQVESSGFGWTDAAIGAMFGIGLALLGVIATVTLRNRHGRMALGA